MKNAISAVDPRPVAGMVIGGVLLGAASGGTWQVVSATMRQRCLTPYGMCGLDEFLWGPAMIAGAMLVGTLIMSAFSTRLRQSRVAVVTTTNLLIAASAWFFAAFKQLGWYRLTIPAAILGLGFGVVAMVTGWTRTSPGDTS